MLIFSAQFSYALPNGLQVGGSSAQQEACAPAHVVRQAVQWPDAEDRLLSIAGVSAPAGIVRLVLTVSRHGEGKREHAFGASLPGAQQRNVARNR